MPIVLDSLPATDFRDPRAVETWDESFRWRVGGVLRDVTVDDTWSRVARALTDDERRAAAYRDAFSRWRLLPDARVLRHAGTDRPPRCDDRVYAVVNIAAFVAHRAFDHIGFGETIALAALLADDQRRLVADGAATVPALVVPIGFDAARERLALAPGSRESHELAIRLAAVMVAGLGPLRVGLAPQPLLARLANHVGDGFDGPDRAGLVDAVRSLLPERR